MSIEKLKKHEVFGLLTPDEVKQLSAVSGVITFKAGEKVYSEGIPASHIFILLKGRVELNRPTKSGTSLLIDDLIAEDIFGVSSLLGADRYLLNAQCVEDSEVLKIEGKALRQIIDQNPTVGCTMQRRVSQIIFNRYVNVMERLQTVVQSIPISATPRNK
jgi:CRP-like cAMP-binding protein